MKLGTKSVLFGAHAFWLHPWFVALAWWILYGFPWDPRLWVSFFVHDLGYLGKESMDDELGETHPLVGAGIIKSLFDRKPYTFEWKEWHHRQDGVPWRFDVEEEFNKELLEGWEIVHILESFTLLKRPRYRWYDFVLLHSRFYSRKLEKPYSRLCVADKLAICLTPSWLYLPMVNLTGEVREYMALSQRNGNTYTPVTSQRSWHRSMCTYVKAWVDEHKDGKADTWTPATR